ncbi:MAG: glycoside hydrolase family 97 protein [Chitinophagaceae bacterium]|nr:glycoside hydrolase family 97 protein [Chitinophagaceae bacterium]
MKYLLSFLMLPMAVTTLAQQIREVTSPDGSVRLNIYDGTALSYMVTVDNKLLIEPSPIDLVLDNGTHFGGKPVIRKTKLTRHNDIITSPVPEKRRLIPDRYNQLTLQLAQPFSVIFRVYDDGVAYRIQTHFTDSITIREEKAVFRFHGNYPVYFTQVVKRGDLDIFHTSFEEPYDFKPLDSIGPQQAIFTPTLVAPAQGPKILITESDLEDYPGMFLKGNNDRSLEGLFAPYPIREDTAAGEFPQLVVKRRADYIARTAGSRKLPWRVMLIARTDRELPANDLVYRLASPSRVTDASWIRPGKGTDEWIIGVNLFNVPFKSGVNTATYKYYIDFAKRFGFQRIMMDAGWSDYKDLFKINPAINMDSIAAYAREKGIGLSLWTLALTLDRQLEPALEQFSKWGVDFIMTDFMDRDDQKMVRFYHRVAEACARHRIMIMYHGAFKPAGINRTWPNAVTREGVLGSEYNIWSDKASPPHNLLLPFIRMTAGPMDYEPGLLDNATARTFRAIGDKVMSLGTRCQQAAMFVIYDSPVQLFSGNPSQGLLEPDFMELIGSIPTVWDTTVISDGQVGEYIVTARRSGDDWFIAGMTSWTARDYELDFSFLNGDSYAATICADGVNADRYASDYKLINKDVSRSQQLRLHMAPGGGFLIRLKKK